MLTTTHSNLSTPGNGAEQVREIVESGMKGTMRKEKKKEERENRYRSSTETLEERNVKKLTENTTWYREVDNPDVEEKNDEERKKEKSWNGWRKFNMKRKRNVNAEIDVDGKPKIMSVIFVQHTEKSELAKRMREKFRTLEKVGDLKLKIVKRTGTKLEDLLHKSNPWSDKDCGREDCLLCESATEEEKKGQCMKRNVVYETYCIECQEIIEMKEEERKLYKDVNENNEDAIGEKSIEESKKKRKRNQYEVDKKEMKTERKKKKNYKVKYIGETGRSGYERGLEHLKDFENCEETSHLLKHYLLYHKDIKKNDMRFGMRLRRSYRTPIERQIGEAVAIDVEKRGGTNLMNSRSEYNRCQIAKISTKSEKETLKEIEKEVKEEERLKEDLKLIRIKKREKKLKEKEERGSKTKRRKKDESKKVSENEIDTLKLMPESSKEEENSESEKLHERDEAEIGDKGDKAVEDMKEKSLIKKLKSSRKPSSSLVKNVTEKEETEGDRNVVKAIDVIQLSRKPSSSKSEVDMSEDAKANDEKSAHKR